MKLLMITRDPSLRTPDGYPDNPLPNSLGAVLEHLRQFWTSIDVILYLKKYPRITWHKNNVSVHTSGGSNFITATLGAWQQVKNLLQSGPAYDLVVSADPGLLGWIGYRTKKNVGIPLLVEIHSGNFSSSFKDARNFQDLMSTLVQNIILKHADSIRTMNRIQTNAVLNLGISKNQVTELFGYHRLDLNHFNPINTKLDTPQFKIPHTDRFALYVGRLAKEKNLSSLLQSWKHVQKKSSGKHLVIAGDGPLRNQLENEVRKLGIEKFVTFLGFVKDELPHLYRSAAMLIVYSRYESGPWVIAESLACGTPVLSTNVGKAADWIKNGENGYIAIDTDPVNFGQLIVDAYKEPKLRKPNVSKTCRSIIETITKEYGLQRYKELLITIATEKNRSDI